MDRELIRNRIIDKYIAPTEKKREAFIGVEIELPIVNLSRRPVDFAVIHQLTEEFIRTFRFEPEGRDDEGFIYAAKDPGNGDILSYDCSYNNLEFSFGREKNLHAIRKRFQEYYQWFQDRFKPLGYTLTGMGVNPFRKYNHNVPIPNERYRMLFHHLASYERFRHLPMYFHDFPAYGTFSSASQVQLDVDREHLTETIRVFSKLEPVKAVLFSNSVLLGDREDLLCCRDMMWENSSHGINPHNIGMFQHLPESVEELCDYIENSSLYCVMRDGKYINFEPVPLPEYFSRPFTEGEVFNGTEYEPVQVIPEIDDLEYLRTFKFEDLTFRGTIEYRSVCCQPVSDAMTVAAFHIGLKEKLEEADRLMEEDRVLYHHGYDAAELRKLLVKRQRPAFIDEDGLYELCKKVLDLAGQGLKERGFGEEIYLEPLYERVKNRQNPAEVMLEALEQGRDIREIIQEFAAVSR